MIPLPTQCPLTGGPVIVTRIYSPESGITMEGEFVITLPFAQLSPEQLRFVETFVRCEGKLNRMEEELKLSYPTIRARLHEVIRALGHEPRREETESISPAERKRILQELDSGTLGFEEAMQLLQGGD
ncbi:MAG: DUF2089 domain-containing protein [Caldilineaceae bacterium]|nr:DUF2089 domain-containing protein [Caldilineaceae bacterium]